MSETSWTEIIVQAPDAEERSGLLFDAGALGIEVMKSDTLRAFFNSALPELRERIKDLGFTVLQESNVEKRNWTAACGELWKEVRVGAIAIRPVESAEAAAELPPKRDEIRIIPGLGFGTGHHVATQNILQMLQAHGDLSARRALDIGTGSGILAIAIAKLCPQASVTAIDIDPLALENAAENKAINQADRVSLQRGSLESVEGKFDLIVGNLYGELICELAPKIVQLIDEPGALVLSGIVAELLPEVERAFPWPAKIRRIHQGWAGLLFEL